MIKALSFMGLTIMAGLGILAGYELAKASHKFSDPANKLTGYVTGAMCMGLGIILLCFAVYLAI